MFSTLNFSPLKISIFFLGIFACLWFVTSRVDVVAILGNLTFTDGFLLLMLTLLILLVMSMQFDVLIRVFKVNLNFNEWFGLTAINAMANYLLPAKTGSAVRGVYLKQKHSFSFSHYTSVVASSHLISLGITILVGLVCVFLVKNSFVIDITRLATGLVALLLFLIASYSVLVVVAGNDFFGKKISKIFSMIKDGFTLLWKSKTNMYIYSFLVLLTLLLWSLRLQICFSALGVTVEYQHILLIQSIVNLSFLFALTPGNIGIKEGVTALAAGYMGINMDVAILASLLDRVFAMIVVFIIGFYYSGMLLPTGEKQ